MTGTTPDHWAALIGRWNFEGNKATYLGSLPHETLDTGKPVNVGLALSNVHLWTGAISSVISLGDPRTGARLMFGREATGTEYCTAGIGGDDGPGYVVDRSEDGRYANIALQGSSQNLKVETPYRVHTSIRGQTVTLTVDEVQVIETRLVSPLAGTQTGLMAWGPGPVTFDEVTVEVEAAEVFVVMEFSSAYDTLYENVIRPVCAQEGFTVTRADDINRPGVIMQDIIDALVRADVVVAEITPTNANVYYELGFAHGLNKPTILLADKARTLPFDLSGWRCLFYENSIGGKAELERGLEAFLQGLYT